MEKQDIINKLKELGINSDNCYPKKSFIDEESMQPVVGLYRNEFVSDFYFFVEFDKTLYAIRKPSDLSIFKEDVYRSSKKWLVPLSLCEIIWKDKPLEDTELPDEPFSKMTLRQYACIHLKVANSGILWLDRIIQESNNPTQYGITNIT